MVPVILALCFALKIFRCSEHYAPKISISCYRDFGNKIGNSYRECEMCTLVLLLLVSLPETR